jgi:hypothetical protein
VPAAASSWQTHQAKNQRTKEPVPSFSRIAPALRRRIAPIPYHLPSLIRATCLARASAPSIRPTRAAFQLVTDCLSEERRTHPYSSLAALYHLRSLTRATCFARKRAVQPNQTRAALQLVTACAASSAQHLFFARRNRGAQWHLVPPALWPPPLPLTLQLRQEGDSSPPQNDPTEFPTACAASSAQHALRVQARLQPNQRELHFSSLHLALIHPRNTPLRAASADGLN